MKAIGRRVERLEAQGQTSQRMLADPVTGEHIAIHDLLGWATDQELSVAEVCLKADRTEAVGRWGCFDPEVGVRICDLPETERSNIVSLILNRLHDRRKGRRLMPSAELQGIEPDGLERLLGLA